MRHTHAFIIAQFTPRAVRCALQETGSHGLLAGHSPARETGRYFVLFAAYVLFTCYLHIPPP